jgi:hypothetical protein
VPTVDVTVRVKDEDGFALEGATVKIYGANGSYIMADVTDASGVFAAAVTSSEAPPGGWSYRADLASYAPGGGGLVFTAATGAEAECALYQDPAPP